MLLAGSHPGSWFGWIMLIHTCSVFVSKWLWSQSEARPPSSESGSPLRLQINHRLMPISHCTLPSQENFFFFLLTLPSGNYQNLLPDLSNHYNPGQIPCDIHFNLFGFGISESRHPCFIPIWSAVQHLMTVTSSETDTHYNITPLCLIQLLLRGNVSPSCGK